MDSRIDYGKIFRARRKGLGWSLQQVAEKARLRKQSISSIENNLQKPLKRTVEDISKALGLNPETLEVQSINRFEREKYIVEVEDGSISKVILLDLETGITLKDYETINQDWEITELIGQNPVIPWLEKRLDDLENLKPKTIATKNAVNKELRKIQKWIEEGKKEPGGVN